MKNLTLNHKISQKNGKKSQGEKTENHKKNIDVHWVLGKTYRNIFF